LNSAGEADGIGGTLARFGRKPFSAYAFYTFGEHNRWVQSTVRRAVETTDRFSPDGGFASFGGEYWNLGAAYRIAKRLKIPLILDFRDGWDWFFGFNGRRSIIYPMMRRFVRRSTLITAATQSVLNRLIQFWPDASVEVVHNGFDIDGAAFALGSRTPTSGELKIGYLGTFWPNPRWHDFRHALEQVSRTTSIRLIYRGTNPNQFRQVVSQGVPVPSGLTLDIGGLCDHSEIIALYGKLDAIVAAAFEADQSMGAIPAKLIEAIGFSKPMIVLADQSPAYLRHFLRGCPSPYLIFDDDASVTQMASYILSLRDTPRSLPRMPVEYSARRRAEELAGKLLGVL
jgi:glycosyltransferase involved in cell wall biosynthesis